MPEYSPKPDNTNHEDEELVEALLRLPSKNLETRIDSIETEIKEREQMRNHILSKLETFKGQLKSHKERLKYLPSTGQSQTIVQKIAGELLKIDIGIGQELKDCFKDISRLKERLQEAREEFEMEKKKLALVSDKNQNGNHRRNRRPVEKTKAVNGEKS